MLTYTADVNSCSDVPHCLWKEIGSLLLQTVCHLQTPSCLARKSADGTTSISTTHPWTSLSDYWCGPVYTKYGYVCRPVLVKTYICVFVSFSVRAVHWEPVSDLSAEAFLATLRRFVSGRGKPKEMFLDNGTNFVGVSRELKQHVQIPEQRNDSKFCVSILC